MQHLLQGESRAAKGRGSVSNLEKNDTTVFYLFVHKVLTDYMGRYYFNARAKTNAVCKANLRWKSFIFSSRLIHAAWRQRGCGPTIYTAMSHLQLFLSRSRPVILFISFAQYTQHQLQQKNSSCYSNTRGRTDL